RWSNDNRRQHRGGRWRRREFDDVRGLGGWRHPRQQVVERRNRRRLLRFNRVNAREGIGRHRRRERFEIALEDRAIRARGPRFDDRWRRRGWPRGRIDRGERLVELVEVVVERI